MTFHIENVHFCYHSMSKHIISLQRIHFSVLGRFLRAVNALIRQCQLYFKRSFYLVPVNLVFASYLTMLCFLNSQKFTSFHFFLIFAPFIHSVWKKSVPVFAIYRLCNFHFYSILKFRWANKALLIRTWYHRKRYK